MDLHELRARRDEILEVAAAHGARNVRVVGSTARGRPTDRSDVDFLVDLDPTRTLLDLGGLQMDLQRLLGRRVDVAVERGLRDKVRARLLEDAVAL